MGRTKSSWRNILYIFLLMAAIVVLFYWYSSANSKRIESQNLNYAMDSTRQTAKRISGEFSNALLRIRNYAYILGTSPSEPVITKELLDGMEENAAFDAFRFTSPDGTNLDTDAGTSDSIGRHYYTSGMQGESGVDVIFDSKITNEPMMAFYTPLYYGGEIRGLLLGLYFAEDYLQAMLDTSYFGEAANVYLCAQDGTVIASSSNSTIEGRTLLDALVEEEVIDPAAADGAWEVFRSGQGEKAFLCEKGYGTDNLCVAYVPGSEFVLVQTFPQSVTTSMVNAANYIGMLLEIVLVGLFIAYILILLIRLGRERKLLRQENQEMGYVTTGLRTLFPRFVLVDLESGTYRYLAGTRPDYPDLPASGRYEDLSSHLCALLPQEDERQRFAQQLAPQTLIQELGADHTDVQYEYRIRQDESDAWEHINIICLERKDQKACKLLFLQQDVTSFKEKELKTQAEISSANRKERQYRIAVTSSSFCTFEFNLTQDRIEQDITSTVGDRPVALLEKVGLTAPCPASLCFEKWKAFVSDESLEEYSATVDPAYLKERFAAGEAEVTVDYWGHISSDAQMCVRQSFIMTRDDSGDIVVMVLTRDITAQVQKQQEQTQALKEALLQAQHANNAKTTFLSNMSHDIRTPMNAIIGFTTIAVSHIDNQDQVRECLQKVLSSSNHLLSLINDILDMSRIESGKVQIKEQDCNISELTHNLVNIIQPQVKAKQMELFIDTFDVANEDIVADPLKLSQVFVNLLSNAVKYTPAGGTVSFRIVQETTFHRGYGDYEFIVKDNGIGMSPEFVEHIFEPFERESSATKSGIQGSGLGMAITKNIIDMMGGEIVVNSEKGKGTEIHVRLSLKLQDVEKNIAQIKELEGLRALVVDDDLDSCDSVTRMLKQIGMRAEWTTSGREAAFRAKSAYNEGDSYHTYIIDWQMPEMSGIEATRRIRAAVGEEVPIIILTAYDWTDIEEDAKEAGVSAFCAKPLFMSDLKAVLLAANDLLEKEEPAAAAWTTADFTGKRILLVEDNELNREIAQSILEETGFVVETAPDGTDAVDMMQKAPENYYDAILMDVQMPVMDGYEATRTIRAMARKDAKDIPIIAMTANAMEEDKETALKSGMNAHIAKPIDMDLFISILKKYIN